MPVKKKEYFLECADRYVFDFKHCSPSKGYSQADTDQDASYYGHWANPFDFKLVSYVEGDVTIEETDMMFKLCERMEIDLEKDISFLTDDD